MKTAPEPIPARNSNTFSAIAAWSAALPRSMASPTQVRSDVPNFGTGEKECNRQCFRPCGYQRSALGTDAWGETPFRGWAGEHGGEIEGVGRRSGERVSPVERRSQSAPRTLGTRRERDEKPGSRSKGSRGVAGDPRSAGVSACRIACVPLASADAAWALRLPSRAVAGGTHCATASRRLALREPLGIPRDPSTTFRPALARTELRRQGT